MTLSIKYPPTGGVQQMNALDEFPLLWRGIAE
jgi:hypothetical protein